MSETPKTLEQLKDEEMRLYQALSSPGMTEEEKQSYSEDLTKIQDKIANLQTQTAPTKSPQDIEDIIEELKKRNLLPIVPPEDIKKAPEEPPIAEVTLASASWKQIGKEIVNRIMRA